MAVCNLEHALSLDVVFNMVTGKVLHNLASMLRIFSDNRGILPAPIALARAVGPPSDTHTPLEAAKDELFFTTGASKIFSSRLHHFPAAWLGFMSQKCTSLRHLSLSFVWMNNLLADLFWKRGPKLQRPLNNLTMLELFQVPRDICFELLEGCPNITKFFCTEPLDPISGCPFPARGKITIPMLKQLRWDPWDLDLFYFFHFPALHHIVWPFVLKSTGSFKQYVGERPHSIDTMELLDFTSLEVLSEYLLQLRELILSNASLNILPIIRYLHDTTLFPSFCVLKVLLKEKRDLGALLSTLEMPSVIRWKGERRKEQRSFVLR
jgi:hypothetical protein